MREDNFEITPNNQIFLQRVTPADVNAYIEIDKKVASKTYFPARGEKAVLDDMAKGPVYMIRKEGKIVGTVSYQRQEDGSVFLNGLAIDPAYWGQGLGREALVKVLEEIKDALKVWLVTHPDNEKAINLYQSLGFQITGRKENYYGDGEPRIILTLISQQS